MDLKSCRWMKSKESRLHDTCSDTCSVTGIFCKLNLIFDNGNVKYQYDYQ